MRITETDIFRRFFGFAEEPYRLHLHVVGRKEELQKLFKLIETECGKNE